MNDVEQENWRTWFDAGARPDVDDAIRAIYRQVEAAIAARQPTCWISGRCCNFNQYGHRLYVTGLETAWMLGRLESAHADGLGDWPARLTHDGPCPFQVNGLCCVHAIRPLGCRLFFCQEGTQDWQHELYERMQAQLRRVHERFDLPYRYAEWRHMLGEALDALRPRPVTAAPSTPPAAG